VDICEGNTSTYNLGGAVSPVYASPVFQWQLSTDSGTSWKDISGATTLSYQCKPTNAGKYWYRLSVSERSGAGISSCRISSNIITVNVHGSPLVNAGPDRILFAGDSVTLVASVTGENPVYLWDPPDHLSSAVVLNPNTSPPANINYNLLATSAYGCAASDGVFVKVVGGIYVPNAFTPNQDGKNDHWRIPFLDPLLDAEVNVFNRYGQLVYHVRGQTVDWDGTFKGMPQEGGVYVYQINYKKHNDMMNIRGTVLLMR
jgi:gliding motility-associated-like protein